MNKQTFAMIGRLQSAGVSEQDAWQLRRIAMTLHRWSELECGSSHGCVERDEVTGKPFYRYSDGNKGHAVADRERGALKRLESIMTRYADKGLSAYVQTDPRGAPLYLIRPGDVPVGDDVASYYNRGIAVHK